jgi:hypothetical protein
MTAVSSEDIASDGPMSRRGKSTDCMTFWSTVPGFASFRHEIEGEYELFSCYSLGRGGMMMMTMTTRKRRDDKSRSHCKTGTTIDMFWYFMLPLR